MSTASLTEKTHGQRRMIRRLLLCLSLFILLETLWLLKQSIHTVQFPRLLSGTIQKRARPDEYIALLYSGTVRSFSRCFRSQLINVIASSPFKVHLFFHAYTNDISLQLDQTKDRSSSYNVLSLNSTLDYFSHFQDIDGQWIQTRDIIRGFQVHPISENDITTIYKAQIDEIARHEKNPETPPLLLYLLLHASTLVDQLRLQYQNHTGIRYKWVMRIRYDMLFRSNLWDSLYEINPRTSTTLPSSSFDLHEMRYIPRHPPSPTVVYLPDCEHWGGVNDHLGISSSELHTQLYPDRARLDVLRSLYASATQLAFRFHAETSLRSRATQLNVAIVKLAMCFSNLRLQPKRPDLCSFTKPVTRTMRGNDCCNRFCKAIETRSQERSSLIGRLFSLEDYAAHYGLSSTTSNFYYFHVSRQAAAPCFHADWNKTKRWDAFEETSFPFIQITSDGDKQRDFERFSACQNPVF